jgi:hypothetical protein
LYGIICAICVIRIICDSDKSKGFYAKGGRSAKDATKTENQKDIMIVGTRLALVRNTGNQNPNVVKF